MAGRVGSPVPGAQHNDVRILEISHLGHLRIPPRRMHVQYEQSSEKCCQVFQKHLPWIIMLSGGLVMTAGIGFLVEEVQDGQFPILGVVLVSLGLAIVIGRCCMKRCNEAKQSQTEGIQDPLIVEVDQADQKSLEGQQGEPD